MRRAPRTFTLVVATALFAACADTNPAEPTSTFTRSTDAQLWAAIVRVDGRVSVGFKEAATARGVDATGRNVTSAETTEAMKRLLRARGMVFSWQASGQPAVAGRIPLSLPLVTELRRHQNIDYLEPYTSATTTGQ